MKNIKLLIFSILIFLTLIVNVNAEDKFTWVCQYTYSDGTKSVGVKYQITNIPESVVTNTQSLTSSGKNYLNVSYRTATGSWKATTSNYITDCSGCSALEPFAPMGSVNQIKNNFAVNSFKNRGATCPTIYIQALTPTLYNNGKEMTKSGPTCQKNGQSVSCSNMVSSSAQDTSKPLSCEYRTEAISSKKKTFKLTYDSKNGLQFDGGSTGLYVEWKNKAALEERFAAAKSQGKCPSRVVCNTAAVGKKIQVGVQSSDFSGSNKCGEIVTNDGESVGDVGNYTALLLQGNPLEISDEKMTCEQLLGKNLVKVLHLFITAVRIAGAIIAIVSGMLALIPAVASDDANALKTATKKCVIMAVILVAIGIFPTIVNIIGKIAGFDLSCL